MTTNHRPTLEAKKGRAHTFSDSIKHARNLPQQKQLKLRGDIDEDVGRRAVEELKSETLQANINDDIESESESECDSGRGLKRSMKYPGLASKRQDSTRMVSPPLEPMPTIDDSGSILGGSKVANIKDTNNGEVAAFQNIKDNCDDDQVASDDNDNDNDSNDSDSDSDSDSNEEILQELAKIKQEKEDARAAKTVNDPKLNLLTSNPLLNLEQTSRPKKSWRSTTFRNKKETHDSSEYTTNTIESSAHKKFLSKYIR